MLTVVLSSTGESREYRFPAATAIAPADYDGDGITDLAVVSFVDQRMLWQIERKEGGRPRRISFGRRANTFLTGCNFFEDRKHELAVVRTSGTIVVRTVDSDFVQIRPISERFPPETAFGCADFDGDGIDEFTVGGFHHAPSIRAPGGRRMKRSIRIFDLNTGAALSIRTGRVRAIQPTDLDGDGLEEIGVFNSTSRFRVVSPGMSPLTFSAMEFVGVAPGIFGPSARFGILIKGADGMLYLVNKDSEVTTITAASKDQRLLPPVSTGSGRSETGPKVLRSKASASKAPTAR